MKKSYMRAVSTVFIWSTTAAVVKLLLFNIPNLEALSISCFIPFFFLLFLNIKNGKIKELKNYSVKDFGIMGGLGFLGLFVYNALYFYGLSQLSSQEACILNYLWPIMLVLFSCIILREKVTFMKVFAILCSFIGIIILSMGTGTAGSGNAVLGIAACIAAAACYGLFCVLNKKAEYDQGIAMMINWFVAAVGAMILGLVTETWVPIRGTQWIGMLWFGIIVNGVGYLWWALALNEAEDSAKIANLAYLVPFLSLIVSAILVGEKLELRAVVALIFIIGGILLQSLYERRQTK